MLISPFTDNNSNSNCPIPVSARRSVYTITLNPHNNSYFITECGWFAWGHRTSQQLLWSECVCPPPIHTCWNPNAQCDGICRWGLWETIRSWGQGLLNGISDFIKKPEKASKSLSTTWGDSEKSATWKRDSPESDHAGTLILDFQPLELWEIHFCCLLVTQSVVLCYSSLNRLRQWQNQVSNQVSDSKVFLPYTTPCAFLGKKLREGQQLCQSSSSS